MVDTDTLFLADISELFSRFGEWTEQQCIGHSPELADSFVGEKLSKWPGLVLYRDQLFETVDICRVEVSTQES